jgi:hypothetical protein
VIAALGGMLIGIPLAIWGFMMQNGVVGTTGIAILFLGMILAGTFSGNSSYKATVVLKNIAENVEAKYQTKIELDKQVPEDMWESLDKPRFYTFRTAGNITKHEMYFLPTSEPVIIESSPAPSMRTSNNQS